MIKPLGEPTVTTQQVPLGLCVLETDCRDFISQSYFDYATVVTRSPKGEIISRYGDDAWDFRSHSKDGSSAQTLHFWRASQVATDDALRRRIYEQHKALFWLLADNGDIKTFGTLNSYNSAAHNFCTISYKKGVDLFALLTDVEEFGAVCDEMGPSDLDAANAMIQVLWRYRSQLLAIDTEMQRDKIIKKIRAVKAQLPDGKQTPLIPSRIYCSILAGLLAGLDTIERDLDLLLAALHNSHEATVDIQKRRPQANTEQVAYARRKALAETAEHMRRLGWETGTLSAFLRGKISDCQTHLMHTVVAFSGMRVGEAKLLPLSGALEIFQNRGHAHYLIKGYTYKLHGGEKVATEWITIDQGHRAIKLAIRIGQSFLSLHAGRPQEGQEALLFPSTSNPFKMMPSVTFNRSQMHLIKSICPEITAEDLNELNRLELERGWDRNRIEVGKPWPLAMHQLRRSLSVYAHRSGIVSLPALKAQLQHITDEMRAYYANGWSRAVNLVFDKDHFSHEWNAAKIESTYFGMTGALKFAFDEGDDLLGLGAQRMEQILSKRSRKQTFALIKSGTIAYRETVLGGCVSTEECKVMPLTPINFECVTSNCASLVVRRKRMDFVIRTQEIVVAQLARDEKGSVEQRIEAEHLKRMVLARERLNQATTEKDAKT